MTQPTSLPQRCGDNRRPDQPLLDRSCDDSARGAAGKQTCGGAKQRILPAVHQRSGSPRQVTPRRSGAMDNERERTPREDSRAARHQDVSLHTLPSGEPARLQRGERGEQRARSAVRPRDAPPLLRSKRSVVSGDRVTPTPPATGVKLRPDASRRDARLRSWAEVVMRRGSSIGYLFDIAPASRLIDAACVLLPSLWIATLRVDRPAPDGLEPHSSHDRRKVARKCPAVVRPGPC